MKPVIGISKNLGHGVRVGFALPIAPPRKKGKREEANEKFVREATCRVQDAVIGYLASHGVLATPGTVSALDHDTRLKHGVALDSLAAQIGAVNDAIRLFGDTGSIQQPTKERVMRNVYEIERVMAERSGDCDLQNQVASMRQMYAAKRKEIYNKNAVLVVVGTVAGMMSGSFAVVIASLLPSVYIQLKREHIGMLFNKPLSKRMADTKRLIVAQTVDVLDVLKAAA